MKELLTICFLLSTLSCSAQVLQQRAVRLMGSRFDITIVSKDTATANAYIDTVVTEVSRIENLISDKKKVIYYPILGYWLDIGKMDDFKKAQEEINYVKF